MAADCNKPIWSLHLNSKCEISSLAKRRRRRPFALALSGGVCVCVRFAWTCRAGSASCFACAPCATCSSSVGPWRHKGHKPRLELQCLFLSMLLLLLSVRLSICLIWVYATFMLINTFMTCATVSSPLSSSLRHSTGNCQFGLNFNWPIWACFGAACSCQAKPSQVGISSKWTEVG